MNWDHLRVFLAVARHGQLLGASRRLGLNHATAARRLEALEDALGTPLFKRRPGGSVLTQAGERLLPVSEAIETQILGIAEEILNEGGTASGSVRIGVPDGLGNYFLAAELGSLTRQHPDLVVELVPLPRAFSLSRREADLAISLDRPTEGRLVSMRLVDFSLGVYGASAYLERHGTPRSPEDLAGHVAVTGVDDLAYATALDYGRALDRWTNRAFRCASVVGQLEAVRAGTGVGILHDFASVTAPDLVRILPEIAFRRSYHLLSHPETAGLRRIEVCREFIVRRFREERRRFLPNAPLASGP